MSSIVECDASWFLTLCHEAEAIRRFGHNSALRLIQGNPDTVERFCVRTNMVWDSWTYPEFCELFAQVKMYGAKIHSLELEERQGHTVITHINYSDNRKRLSLI